MPAWPHVVHARLGDDVVLGISVVRAHPTATSVRLVLAGELCSYSAPLLRELIEELIDDGVTDIDVKLAKLQLCTAAGVNVLIAANEALGDRGGALGLWEPHGVVARVLRATEVDAVLCPSEHDRSGTSPRASPPGSRGRSRRGREPVA